MSLWLVKSSRLALFLSREQWQLWGRPTVGPSSPAAVLCAWGGMTRWSSSNWTDPDQHNTCFSWQSTGRPNLVWGFCVIIPHRVVMVPCVLRYITFDYLYLCVVQKRTTDEGFLWQSYKEQKRRTKDSGSRENNRLECPLCSEICNVQCFSVFVSQQMNHIIHSDDCGLSNQCPFCLPYFKGPKELTLKALWSLDFFSIFFPWPNWADSSPHLIIYYKKG